MKQVMAAAWRKLLKSGHREQFLSFAVIDVVFKLAGAPQENLGGEMPHERMTGNPFHCARLCKWGSDSFVHQHAAQRGVGSKFDPHVERRVLLGHD